MKKRNLSVKKLVKLSAKEFYLYNKFENRLSKVSKQKKLAKEIFSPTIINVQGKQNGGHRGKYRSLG